MRDRLFRGELVVLPEAALELAVEARAVVLRCFAEEPESMESKTFAAALKEARELVATPRFQELAWKAVGVSEPLMMDLVRLRAVSPGLENIEVAAPVFYCHRDTWYGNPSCQINGWTPLHEVNQANSFRFYTEYFERAIENDSHRFVAQEFLEQGGFGRVGEAVGSVYPKALREPQGHYHDIEQKGGDLLLFSASHLHQTKINRSGRVRFSVDFRFFSPRDLEAGLGAPDPDNASRGHCLESYRLVGP